MFVYYSIQNLSAPKSSKSAGQVTWNINSTGQTAGALKGALLRAQTEAVEGRNK